MYIEKTNIYIAKTIKLCYTYSMDNFFEEKTNYNQISFRYAKGSSLHSGNEIHSYHEILYYIDGDATFLSTDFKEELSKGTLLLIPKEMYHNFHIVNQNQYTRLVMTFPDLDIIKDMIPYAMSQIRIIKNININIRHLLNRMCEVICDTKTKKNEIFLYGTFLTLIAEINFDITNAITPRLREKEHLISRCLSYIEENYTSAIHVDDIAKEMCISSPTLFQYFKNELGVSIHKYITEKRMILARKLIYQGENPTKIYAECGFRDYSSFYKAYTKMFLLSPADDKKRQNGKEEDKTYNVVQ